MWNLKKFGLININSLFSKIDDKETGLKQYLSILKNQVQQLNEMIDIYNTSVVFLRRHMLTYYVKSKRNLNIRLVHFYENALQHYLYNIMLLKSRYASIFNHIYI